MATIPMSFHDQPKVCFTLDVLSDGSEFSGASLFLSVWKRPSSSHSLVDNVHWLRETMNASVPLARYAIAGLGDLTARLCADQRLKLASTKAVFLPSSESSAYAEGLGSLLLNLHSRGAASLHVVCSRQELVEEIASVILGNYRHLNIQTCAVPEGKEKWWKVFEDDFLTVHGSRAQTKITFLYSLKLHNSTKLYTIALVPPNCKNYNVCIAELEQEELPLKGPIDHFIVLNPQNKCNLLREMKDDNSTKPIFLTLPNHRETVIDPGLLRRSQRILRYFSKQMPWAFPAESAEESSSTLSFLKPTEISGNPYILKSCSSIIIGEKSPILLDRRQEIVTNKGYDEDDEDDNILARNGSNDDSKKFQDKWATTLDSLQSFVPKPVSTSDENEIDLDEDDESASEQGTTTRSKPHIIVLGTGCASPSAYRGASGYALYSEDEIYLLDCGEGTATMLTRCSTGKKDWRSQIKGIWISHSHLDHYGGLPALLRILFQFRTKCGSVLKKSTEDVNPTKKRKLMLRGETSSNTMSPPWVMAPPKVLRYLDVLLGCKHGFSLALKSQTFLPFLHHDPTIPIGPWTKFQNIKVYHNCCPSWGLLIRIIDGSTTSWLCYSGDTRPCKSLVQACRLALSSKGESLLLIHEATFEEMEKGKAYLTKHSTIREALSIASQIPASRVLLTHFSQRYIGVDNAESGITLPLASNTTGMPIGYAIDGLKVPI